MSDNVLVEGIDAIALDGAAAAAAAPAEVVEEAQVNPLNITSIMSL